MRLLERKEIDRAKAIDRKNEIDQGKSLAQKVDLLRETVSTEQKNLLAFRNESLKRIQEEIDGFIGNRDELKKEIELMELRKKVLETPELTEWDRVKGHAERMDEELALFDKRQSIREKEKDIAERQRALELEEDRVEDERNRSKAYLLEAENTRKEAISVLAQKATQAEEIQKEIDARWVSVIDKEKQLVYREADLKNKQEEIEKEKKLISEEKLRLKDQRETLERAFARLKKQNATSI